MDEKNNSYECLKGTIGLLIQEHGISTVLAAIVSHLRLRGSDIRHESTKKALDLLVLANSLETARFDFDRDRQEIEK